MKRITLALALSFGFALFLGACAGGGRPVPKKDAEVPVSQQASVGSAQGRAKTHTELGTLYYQAGNMQIASQEARIALDSDPNYAPGYNLLGLIHLYLREMPQAQDNFERASRLAPGDPEIANNYGWLLCQSGRENEALQLFMLSARNPLYKTPTKPYTNAGLCALRLKDEKGAEEYFQRAAQADASNAQAIFHLADMLYRRGDYAIARKYVAEVMRLNPPNAESLWLALRIERKLGDRSAEASYASQLRRGFAGTPQHQALMQGKFE